MTITKNDKTYAIRENEKSWTLSICLGRVPVTYNVKKIDCPTIEDLKAFVDENSAF